MKKIIYTMVAILVVAILAAYWQNKKPSTNITVTNFQECIKVVSKIPETYPRICTYKGTNYTENIGNEIEKKDLIRITTPRPNDTISSPLSIKGEARGVWFFEGSFPIELVNSQGIQIAEGFAKAQGAWMTTEFVPFEATLNFINPSFQNNSGNLILRKDNPSGLPENDDNLQVPINFQPLVQ